VKVAVALLTALALVPLITGAPACPTPCCAPAPSSCCEPGSCECHFDQPAPDFPPVTAAVHAPAIPTAAAIHHLGHGPTPTDQPQPIVSAGIPSPPLYALTHSFLI
jgi:hypothetical protein